MKSTPSQKHLIIYTAICSALICHSIGQPVLDTSTPDAFAESAEAMIEHAKSSGSVGVEDLAKIDMALRAALMESMSSALDKGGPNITPESAKQFVSEDLRKYDGMNAQQFLEEYVRQAKRQDVGSVDPSLKAELQNTFAEMQKYSVADAPYLDVYSGEKNGRRSVYQRIKYDPSDTEAPVDFYEIVFLSKEPHGAFYVIRNLKLGQFALTGLKYNRDKGFSPVGIWPFGAEKQHDGPTRTVKAQVNAPNADAEVRPTSIRFLKKALKHREKFIEWEQTAKTNNVEPFRKPFPGESESGLVFKWGDGRAEVITKEFSGKLTSLQMHMAPDILSNFDDMVRKAPLAAKKIAEMKEGEKRKADEKLDAMFN